MNLLDMLLKLLLGGVKYSANFSKKCGEKMNWFKSMLTENGEMSLTRFLAFASFVAFVIFTCLVVYMVYVKDNYNTDWYSTLTTATMGGTFIQPVNKAINSIFNTKKGSYEVNSDGEKVAEGYDEDKK